MIDKSKWNNIEKNIWQSMDNPKKFMLVLYFGRDAKGKIKKSSKIIYGTLTEARKVLKQHDIDRLHEKANVPSKCTLKDVIDDWNATIGDISTEATTQASNRNLQKHITEFFGEVRLNKITATLIQKYMAYLKTERGLSNNTVNKHRTHLNTLFNYVMLHDDVYGLYKNPMEKVKPLKKEKTEMSIYEPETAKRLLELLHESQRHDLEVAVNLAFWCACRREETCALKWKNVDFKNKTIRICEVRTTAKGAVSERNTTKNGVERKIGMVEWLENLLKNEWEHQKEMKELLGAEYFDNDYVFCHDDGRPWHPNSLSREFKAFLKTNELPEIRYHDLRHTNLSMLMTKMSAVAVAQLGGHKQVSTTTNIYGHSFNNTVEKGVQTLEEIMGMDQ